MQLALPCRGYLPHPPLPTHPHSLPTTTPPPHPHSLSTTPPPPLPTTPSPSPHHTLTHFPPHPHPLPITPSPTPHHTLTHSPPHLPTQEHKEGESVTVTPRSTDLVYIRSCSQCKFRVCGKSAKCIIGESTLPSSLVPPSPTFSSRPHKYSLTLSLFFHTVIIACSNGSSLSFRGIQRCEGGV